METFSLLHPKIAFFYENLSVLNQDVEKYFLSHDNTYNWQQIGNLLRKELKVDSSYLPTNTDFGNLKYEQLRELVSILQPIFLKSLSMQQNILNDFKNFRWLGSNIKGLQVLIEAKTNVEDSSNLEQILLLTAMLEYALGNVFFTKSNGKNPPHLLRDLLSTAELLEVFGWEAIWFLKILLGTPHAINLRNIVWHGFPQPDEMPQYYVSVLIVAINTLGATLCSLGWQLIERPQIVELTRYMEKIQLKLPSKNDLHTTMNKAFFSCTWLDAAHKKYWQQILCYTKSQNWWQLVMLVLPQIELLLRLRYAQANDYDVRAKLDEYYITIDTMFETHVPFFKNTFNKLLLPGTHFINESVLKLMYDLFVAPHGPRIRDKVSHGEVTLECINNAQLSQILLQLSLQLVNTTNKNNHFVYESVFHLNSLTWQGIDNANIFLVQLIQLPLPQGVQNITSEQTKYLQNTTLNIQIFQRPKREAELMQLLLKIAHALTQTCRNYSESVSERCLLLRQRELHSKRRKTLEKMLSSLPEICSTLRTVLCCTEDIFCKMQLVESKENNVLEDVEKTRRFLKQTLQIVENFSKYSAKESNEWIKALELCNKFDESRRRFIELKKKISRIRLQNVIETTAVMVRHEKVLQLAVTLLLISQQLLALQIPKDVEILDGYEFDDSPEYYPTDANYYEARSLLSGLHKSIRNKRSTSAYDNAKKSTSPSAGKVEARHSSVGEISDEHNVGSEHIEVREKHQNDVNSQSLEHLPRAEQQVMDPDFDYYSQRRISTPWNDQYATAPSSDHGRRTSHDDDDTLAEATANYMTRGRQARVNFITQPKKEGDLIKEIPEPILTKVPVSKIPLYDSKYGIGAASYNYDLYPSRSYDPYLRRYDRFDEQYSRYDPYNYEDHHLYRRHYDPYDSYSPRVPQYPEPYYNYPDRRYDIPEPREYSPSLYNNEIYDKAPYPAASYPTAVSVLNKYPDYSLSPSSKYPDYAPNPLSKYPDYPRSQRRIVYYAHLPEIVRTPYDYPYRYNRDRYDGAITTNNGISSAYKTVKTAGVQTVASGQAGAAGAPGNNDRSYDYMKRDKKDHVTPKPNKLNTTSRQ